MTDDTSPIEHVEPQDSHRHNSPRSEGSGVDLGASAAVDKASLESAGHAACYWNDKQYSDGASVCDSHIRYKCWNGKWVEVGQC